MTALNIGHYRLFNQGITQANFETPAQVVAHLGAVQAQDYPGTLWALGLRMRKATPDIIEQAIAERAIVRTWPMRGTLHFVAAADVRWMLKLLTPRIIAGSAARYRGLELDESVFGRSQEIVVRALQGNPPLTRPEMFEVLERGNISTKGQRGYHILGRLSQEGLLCFGPYSGKQPTFVLLDEWLPPTRELEGEEALAELAKRYFTGHGPALLQDFTGWAGLKISEARAGLEMVKAELRREEVDGQTYWLSQSEPELPGHAPAVHLLPGFDEYLLGYKDRRAVLEPEYADRIVPGGNGMFMSTIISNGRVAGTWKRVVKKDKVIINPVPFNPLSEAENLALAVAAERYGRFMNLPVEIQD